MPSDVEPAALHSAAMDAIAAGDRGRALKIVLRALELYPDSLSAWLNYAGLLRASGQAEAAQEAVTQALRVEPRSFHALLMRGSLQDSQGRTMEAAKSYALALLFAPPDRELDRATLTTLVRARQVHADYLAGLSQALRAEIDARADGASAVERRRFDKFVDVVSGRARVFEQRPADFHFPGLPAIEFYDDAFPWLAEVDASFEPILEELRADLSRGMDHFEPYVQLSVGDPVDQWRDLNRSMNWSSLHLKARGKVVEGVEARFPRTLEALARVPQPVAHNRSPVAMFSALQPRTRIPPHHGVTNTRLVMHLPLIVPEGCGFRVGSETRPWIPGKAWVFDDTIEHEAWNDSDSLRVILIADVWNPALSPYEREMYDVMLATLDDFHGETFGSAGGA